MPTSPLSPSRRGLLAVGMAAPAAWFVGSYALADEPAGAAVTLPAVRTRVEGSQVVRLSASTRISVAGANMELWQAGTLLAEELVAEGFLTTRPQVTCRAPRPGDIVLQLGEVEDSTHPEAYRMAATDVITITGVSADGAFWGTRTLLQVLRSAGALSGTIVDWPLLDERCVMIDIGRKYFSPDWIKNLIGEMSYLKMNTLQLHISEGIGFRIECETHPEIVSEKHLTKAEVRDIMAFARRYHVHVNGDVDSPGHLDHILKSFPQYQLRLTNGRVGTGQLDFSKPGAIELITDIIGEMIELFDGPVFHIGGDEYLPAAWELGQPHTITARSAPQLVEWARGRTGNPQATLNDAYEIYMNTLGDFVRSKGKIARMWNDDVRPNEGGTRMDARTELDVWIRWRTTYPNAADYVRDGHTVINSNGDYLYMVLTGSGYNPTEKKSPRGVYERWTPRTFMGAAGGASDFVLPADQPMKGAHVSVWCDSPDALTQEQVAFHLQDWLHSFSQQTWGTPKPVSTFAELQSTVVSAVGAAPAAVSFASSPADQPGEGEGFCAEPPASPSPSASQSASASATASSTASASTSGSASVAPTSSGAATASAAPSWQAPERPRPGLPNTGV